MGVSVFGSVTCANRTLTKKSRGKPKFRLVHPEEKSPERILDPSVQAWNDQQIAKLQNNPKQQNDEPTTPSREWLTTVSAIVQAASDPSLAVEAIRGDTRASIPRGAIVYHGTTFGGLRIAWRGESLVARSARGSVDRTTCIPPPAVHVSSLFKALAFSVQPLLRGNEGGALPRSSQIQSDFPIVVELELPQDVEIILDQDFFWSGTGVLTGILEPVAVPRRQEFYASLHHDPELAALSWSQFSSAGICRDLPTSWIRGIYAPRLVEGTLHRDCLHWIAAALCLEVQKRTTGGGIDEWQDRFEIRPLVSLDRAKNDPEFWEDDQELLQSKVFSLDMTKFRSAVTFQYQKQLHSDPSVLAKLHRANGDMEKMDALFARECHDRAGINIERRIASIREKFLE